MRPFARLAALAYIVGHSLMAQASPSVNQRDCIDYAAAHHGVNPVLLRAIAVHESGLNPSAVARNKNGTRDIGKFQTNSVHLPELARYGISEQHLLDGCVSAFVGAWHLRRNIDRYGLTWFAVGAYHSTTPRHNQRYASAIQAILRSWEEHPKRIPRTASANHTRKDMEARSAPTIVFQAQP